MGTEETDVSTRACDRCETSDEALRRCAARGCTRRGKSS